MWRFSDSSPDSLKVYLDGVDLFRKIAWQKSSLISINYRTSNSRCGFEVKLAKVMDVHEAKVGKTSDMFEEGKVLIENHT